MKRTIIGIAILISATLLDISILISGTIIAREVTEWRSDIGKIGQAILDNSLVLPFILANILFALAIVILCKEYFSK